jgi:hypothetical protein
VLGDFRERLAQQIESAMQVRYGVGQAHVASSSPRARRGPVKRVDSIACKISKSADVSGQFHCGIADR